MAKIPKVVRQYTFQGPVDWLDKVILKSLPEGKTICGVGKIITVKTTRNDSNWEFANNAAGKTISSLKIT